MKVTKNGKLLTEGKDYKVDHNSINLVKPIKVRKRKMVTIYELGVN